MADLERVLSELEASILDNEILRHFAQNPTLQVTAQGLSKRLERAPKSVRQSLERLADAGIVVTKGSGGRTIYQCSVAAVAQPSELRGR